MHKYYILALTSFSDECGGGSVHNLNCYSSNYPILRFQVV